MRPYALAAAEDCSRSLGDYVSIDVLNAIQRTAAKPWVSNKPYDKNACVPDVSVLSLDASKLGNNILEAILWWTKALNLGSERFAITSSLHSVQSSQVVVLNCHLR